MSVSSPNGPAWTWVYTEITWDQILVCLKNLSFFNKTRDFYIKAFVILSGQRDLVFIRLRELEWKETEEAGFRGLTIGCYRSRVYKWCNLW